MYHKRIVAHRIINVKILKLLNETRFTRTKYPALAPVSLLSYTFLAMEPLRINSTKRLVGGGEGRGWDGMGWDGMGGEGRGGVNLRNQSVVKNQRSPLIKSTKIVI